MGNGGSGSDPREGALNMATTSKEGKTNVLRAPSLGSDPDPPLPIKTTADLCLAVLLSCSQLGEDQFGTLPYFFGVGGGPVSDIAIFFC